MKKHLFALPLFTMFVTLLCSTSGCVQVATSRSDISTALDSIRGGDMLRPIELLASDEFEGRGLGTRGQTLTVDYLIEQFKALKLAPGTPDGTYVQNVPLISYTSRPIASFRIGNKDMSLKFPDDFVAWSLRDKPQITIENSDLVFVGYGVIAPEYAWMTYYGRWTYKFEMASKLGAAAAIIVHETIPAALPLLGSSQFVVEGEL